MIRRSGRPDCHRTLVITHACEAIPHRSA
jgi:hypothetical protein